MHQSTRRLTDSTVQKNMPPESARMIRHIVMWRVRGDTPSERAATSHQVKEAFEALRGRIPGMQRLEIGLDVSAVDYACDVVLVADFDSPQALQDYADHPEHLRVRRELEGLRIMRHQVDYPLPAPPAPAAPPTPQDVTARAPNESRPLRPSQAVAAER